MWGNTDFSKLRIEFDAENLHVAVLNANRMVFFESFPSHQHGFYELHYIFGGKGTLICGGKSLPPGRSDGRGGAPARQRALNCPQRPGRRYER